MADLTCTREADVHIWHHPFIHAFIREEFQAIDEVSLRV
jgi:hypothetical protein